MEKYHHGRENKAEVDSSSGARPRGLGDVFVTRRNVLLASLAAGGLFVGHRRFFSKEYATESITLGNVSFYIVETNEISPQKREALFARLKSSYNKLVYYFGEDLMSMAEPIDLSIVVDSSSFLKDLNGMLVWYYLAQGDIDGKPELIGLTRPNALFLRPEREEHVIVHELFHLYLQTAGFWSKSFLEGHAHAVDKILCPRDDSAETDQFAADFDIGLDFESGRYNGFEFNGIATLQYQESWLRFLQIDNDFFRKFYSEITRCKNQGKNSFPRSELIEIAQSVSPQFNDFYKTERSLHEIGEDGEEIKVKAYKLPRARIIMVANLKTAPLHRDADKIVRPFYAPALRGTPVISYEDAEGRSQTIEMKVSVKDGKEVPEDRLILGAKVDADVFASTSLKVHIGDTEVPF